MDQDDQNEAPPLPPSVVAHEAPFWPDSRSNFKSKAAKELGIAQISLGCAIFVTQICANIARTSLSSLAFGFWMGIFFIVTGSYGVVSSKTRENCKIVTYMVLSIIASVIAADLTIIGVLSFFYNQLGTTYGTYYNYMNRDAIDISLAILGFIEMVISIVAASFTCGGICCKRNHAAQITYNPIPT